MIGRRVVAAVCAATLAGGLSAAVGIGPASAASPDRGEGSELVVGTAQVADFLVQHPDAELLSPNQVAWDGGDVVMTFPTDSRDQAPLDQAPLDQAPADRALGGWSTAATTASLCGPGWSCLFEHSGYTGRKLQFRSCGYTQSLAQYGFANAASSWVNNRGSWTRVYDGGSVLWTEYGFASVPNVGSANDRADSIHLFC